MPQDSWLKARGQENVEWVIHSLVGLNVYGQLLPLLFGSLATFETSDVSVLVKTDLSFVSAAVKRYGACAPLFWGAGTPILSSRLRPHTQASECMREAVRDNGLAMHDRKNYSNGNCLIYRGNSTPPFSGMHRLQRTLHAEPHLLLNHGLPYLGL